jgi:ABC-type phosphate transport system substrate-binding protein
VNIVKLAAGTALLALFLAACGSGNAATAPPNTHPSTHAAALTTTQAQTICNDLNTWAKTAANEDEPRFSPQLESDETEASGTSFGSDLVQFDNSLQEMNSDALEPGPPGDEQPIQQVETDCQSYGVTFTPIPSP